MSSRRGNQHTHHSCPSSRLSCEAFQRARQVKMWRSQPPPTAFQRCSPTESLNSSFEAHGRQTHDALTFSSAHIRLVRKRRCWSNPVLSHHAFRTSSTLPRSRRFTTLEHKYSFVMNLFSACSHHHRPDIVRARATTPHDDGIQAQTPSNVSSANLFLSFPNSD